MATIYGKVIQTGTPDTTDNCVILDPRESLIYPFQFGNDWTEIRMGMFFSLCAASGDNTPPPQSTISDASPANKFYCGFKNNNDGFPQSIGTTYIGVMVQQNQGTLIGTQGVDTFRIASNVSNSLSFAYNYNNDFNIESAVVTPIISPLHIDLNTGYFGFLCVKLCITPQNVFTGAPANLGVIQGNDSSIPALRLNTANATFGTSTTGFFTQNATLTGIPLTRPDALFVYHPMFDSRIRINNIIVERYR